MIAILLAATAAMPAGELAAPFLVQAGGKPISVDVGHAAPILVDFDGDGKNDLLVGQFGEGRLRVYKNVGTNQKPAFDKFTWFQAGGTPAKVDAG